MIARGHWFPVYGLGNEYGIFYKKDVPTEISLGWNRESGCHTTPTSFCRRDNAFSQYTSVFASAIAAHRRELGRLTM